MTEIESLKKEFFDSQKKQDEINTRILEMLTGLYNNKGAKEPEPKLKNDTTINIVRKKEYNGVKQPRPDNMVRVQSLTRGELCLSVNGNSVVSFDKYGDIKPILYSELMSIVNNNRSFAESGAFYIMDDSSVYYLGLSRFYDNILSYDEIESLESYSDGELRQILANVPEFQRNVISAIFADKIYNDKPVDRNKVDIISRCFGIDIVEKSRQMRSIADNMK